MVEIWTLHLILNFDILLLVIKHLPEEGIFTFKMSSSNNICNRRTLELIPTVVDIWTMHLILNFDTASCHWTLGLGKIFYVEFWNSTIRFLCKIKKENTWLIWNFLILWTFPWQNGHFLRQNRKKKENSKHAIFNQAYPCFKMVW